MIFLKKMPKSHSLREKNVKLLQLDIMLLEVTKTKQDSKYFLLSWLTSSQIWLNALVHDGQSTTSQDQTKTLGCLNSVYWLLFDDKRVTN
jgi:hypothetical protein